MPPKLTKNQFIEKAKEIHNNKYDYSLVNYINTQTKIKIICLIHGIFEQTPNNHLAGSKCPKCANQDRSNYNKVPYEHFYELVNKVHNNYYQYNKETYKGTNNKIEIICPKHGSFKQIAFAHINGQGCAKCAKNYNYSNQEFINLSNIIHNNKYDYSLTNYKKSHTKVKIICPIHGIFSQLSYHHLQGHGCPFCITINKTSKGEKEVLKYISLIYKGLIIENDRKVLNGKELDIYLPDLKIGIEYNGEYWHKLYEIKNPGYHRVKEDLCKEKGIKLINISDKNWINNKDNIKNFMLNIINGR